MIAGARLDKLDVRQVPAGDPQAHPSEHAIARRELESHTLHRDRPVAPPLRARDLHSKRPPELVRGVDLIGTPLAAFGKFIAASTKVEVFNGVCGAESGQVPVSASSPELLVSEVEVQKKAVSQ